MSDTTNTDDTAGRQGGNLPRSRTLSDALFVIAAGVAAQAALAGMFLSGTGAARTIHLWIGSLLPYFGIWPACAAWGQAKDGTISRRWAWAITATAAGLWVQDALGHMPFPVTTAIHVPLGVLLFGAALVSGIETRRHRV